MFRIGVNGKALEMFMSCQPLNLSIVTLDAHPALTGLPNSQTSIIVQSAQMFDSGCDRCQWKTAVGLTGATGCDGINQFSGKA